MLREPELFLVQGSSHQLEADWAIFGSAAARATWRSCPLPAENPGLPLRFFACRVPAGFPSLASDQWRSTDRA